MWFPSKLPDSWKLPVFGYILRPLKSWGISEKTVKNQKNFSTDFPLFQHEKTSSNFKKFEKNTQKHWHWMDQNDCLPQFARFYDYHQLPSTSQMLYARNCRCLVFSLIFLSFTIKLNQDSVDFFQCFPQLFVPKQLHEFHSTECRFVDTDACSSLAFLNCSFVFLSLNSWTAILLGIIPSASSAEHSRWMFIPMSSPILAGRSLNGSIQKNQPCEMLGNQSTTKESINQRDHKERIQVKEMTPEVFLNWTDWGTQ